MGCFVNNAISESYSTASVGGTSIGTLSTTTIDTMHPYYLHPSDSPCMNLTNITLNENYYSQGSRFALSAKLILGFIDGSHPKPAVNNPLLVH